MAAIVTGASRGIGAAIAKRLAANGHAVLVNYAGNAAQADAVVRAIAEGGGQAQSFQADVADPGASAAMFDAADAAFGGVDVVVGNAGVQSYAALADTSDAVFDMTIAVNLKGMFNTLREAARRVRPGGSIVAVSSGTTRVVPSGLSIYAASKAAVEMMTSILAQEMRGRDVNVNTVSPGPVATDLFLTGKSAAILDSAAQRSPFGRIGAPEDIASVVAMLAGLEGRWIHGQVVVANGGFL